MGVSERFRGANVVDAGRLSPYWGEHAARYRLALSHIADRCVLDIACGTGYGIGLLSETAKFVAGVDVDPVAAAEARAECGDNASVLLGDGLRLPFDDGSFEVITSFETLEHIHERAEFLAELSRVLKSNGTLLLSTPNAIYTQPVNGRPVNPFHVHEYTPDELIDELSVRFEPVEFLGQYLDPAIKIPPFYDAQRRLPKDLTTQTLLFGWKILNKLPFSLREKISESVWDRPFYPSESDYHFSESSTGTAPVLVAICKKK